MQKSPIPHGHIYSLYRAGLYFKGLFGLSEFSVGLFLYFYTKAEIYQLFLILAQEELIEDPSDPLVAFLQQSLLGLSIDTQHFAMTFLTLHGSVKLLLIYGLIKNQLWAYPVSIIIFIIFVLQQLYYLIFATFSWGIFLVTILNIVVIGLIAYEYWYIKKQDHSTS